jgi:hypothetical protein
MARCKGQWREQLWPTLIHYPDIYLQGQKQNVKNCPGQVH